MKLRRSERSTWITGACTCIFECGVWMYGSSAVAQVKEDALITFEQCEQINMDYCRKKNFAVRALRGALKFLAPLL